MATLNDDFKTSVDDVVEAVLGTNSIYEKILKKFDTLYTDMGMTVQEKSGAIAEVSAQLAISASTAAINAGVELAKSAPIVSAQVAEINAKIAFTDQQALAERLKNGDLSYTYTYKDDGTIDTKTLLNNGTSKSIYELQQEREAGTIEFNARQQAAFNDKLLVEVIKALSGVAQMEATTGTTQAETLYALNKSLNLVLKSAGVADDKLYAEEPAVA